MTNRDKRDSIRGRMAETGETFNVARRKIEAAAAGQGPAGGDPYQLIEVEVGSDHDRARRRHFETFWGRWIVPPDPDKTRTAQPGEPDRVYYGVAQTRRGRIAVYRGIAGSAWGGNRLDDYDSLDDAQIPPDIRREAAAALGIRPVIHRDI